MYRLLDKIKSGALALLAGFALMCVASVVAVSRSPQLHAVPFSDVLRFVIEQPISVWPSALTISAGMAIAIGSAVAALAFWLLRGMRWSPRDWSLSSEDSVQELLQRGVAPPQMSIRGDSMVICGGADGLHSHSKPIPGALQGGSTPKALIPGASSGGSKGKIPPLAIWAGKYGGQDLYLSEQQRGLVFGPSGTGKTNFLLNQILKTASQGMSFFAIDFKPEIYGILRDELESRGYRVVLIDPICGDPVADSWNPIAETSSETTLAALCAALLPILSPDTEAFTASQRDWLLAAVFHVQTQPGGSIISAFNLLSSVTSPDQLLDLFDHSPSPAAVRISRMLRTSLAGKKPDPLTLSGLTGCLRSLQYLGLQSVQSAFAHSTFTARDLGRGQPTAVFFKFDENEVDAVANLLPFVITAMLNTLIETAGQRAAVALYLDELGNQPAATSLPKKLATLRSRGLPVWCFFQSVEQINERYARGADSIFFAACDFKLLFRQDEQYSRELLSKLVGTYEREKVSTSSSGRAGGSVSRSRERVNIIEPHQVGRLKNSEVIALFQGAAALGRATPHFIDFPQFRR